MYGHVRSIVDANGRRPPRCPDGTYSLVVSLEMRIALGALCTFNAVIFIVLAGASYEYVDGAA